MDQEKFDKVTKIFLEYTEKVKKLTVAQETQLKLYGLFKQSNFGDNTTPEPGFFDLRSKAKWDAWNEQKGQSKYNSMKRYIQLVKSLQN